VLRQPLWAGVVGDNFEFYQKYWSGVDVATQVKRRV